MGHSLLNIFKCFRKCACGKTETAQHLLLDCKLNESYRNTLVCKIQSILTISNTNVQLNVSNEKQLFQLLLQGSSDLSRPSNKQIFLATKQFLRYGKRFENFYLNYIIIIVSF